MFAVVELHDLARDRGLEVAIIIFESSESGTDQQEEQKSRRVSQERLGSVALPRVKVVLASPAVPADLLHAPARRADDVVFRRIEVAIC